MAKQNVSLVQTWLHFLLRVKVLEWPLAEVLSLQLHLVHQAGLQLRSINSHKKKPRQQAGLLVFA